MTTTATKQQRPRRRGATRHWTRRKRSRGSVATEEEMETEAALTTTPRLSFGLLTDVQYADVDDGWNYSRTVQRYYRNALVEMRAAIAAWLALDKPTLRFAVNLGDLIDGKNRQTGTTAAAIAAVREAWGPFEREIGPVHHLLGNHELYNLTPAEFDATLSRSPTKTTFYDFTVPVVVPEDPSSDIMPLIPRYRFIVLNAYGVSSLGREPGDPVFDESRRRLRAVNPNADLNSPLGLRGRDKRFVEYNGAVDSAQLAWLRETLARARAEGEHVLVFSHVPIHPRSCPPTCLLWNYDEVLGALLDAADCVRAVFSGHVHLNGYAVERGVHFVVCDAILECQPGRETAHAVVDLHDDALVIHGSGKIPTRTLRFPRARE